MRLLFIGQSPSRETDGLPPFVGKCGRFLAKLLGLTQAEMLEQHDFLNVLPHYPGKSVGGDRFPMSEARVAASGKVEQMRGRTVVLLGSNVARAFGFRAFQYGEFYEIRDQENWSRVVVPRVTIVPHPSGICRYYNDPDKRLAIGKFLRELAAK